MKQFISSPRKIFRYVAYSALSVVTAFIASAGVTINKEKANGSYTIDYSFINVCHADTPSGGYSEGVYTGGYSEGVYTGGYAQGNYYSEATYGRSGPPEPVFADSGDSC